MHTLIAVSHKNSVVPSYTRPITSADFQAWTIHSSYTHVLGIVYTQTKSLIPKKIINEKHTKYIQYNS